MSVNILKLECRRLQSIIRCRIETQTPLSVFSVAAADVWSRWRHCWRHCDVIMERRTSSAAFARCHCALLLIAIITPLSLYVGMCFVITARGSDGRIVSALSLIFSLSVNTITHEPMHSAWWTFAQTCILTTFKPLLNIKAIRQRSRSRGYLCVDDMLGNE